MQFKFYYKNNLIELECDTFYAYVCMTSANDYKFICDELSSILRENDCNTFRLDIGDHTTARFSSIDNADSILPIGIAVAQFIENHVCDIRHYDERRPSTELRDDIDEYMTKRINLLSAPNKELLAAFKRYQQTLHANRHQLSETKWYIENFLKRFKKNGQLRQIVEEMSNAIFSVIELLHYSSAATTFSHLLAGSVAVAYQKVIAAERKSRLRKMGLTKNVLATLLRILFKKFFETDEMDAQAFKVITALNPIDISYDMARYYYQNQFEVRERKFLIARDLLYRIRKRTLRWIRLAIELDQGKKLPDFLRAIDPRFILEWLELDPQIGLCILINPDLRQGVDCESIITRCAWTEKTALELITLIADTPSLITFFSVLKNLTRFSSVCYLILSKPTLLNMPGALVHNPNFNVGHILRGAYQSVMADIDASVTVSDELKCYIKVTCKSMPALENLERAVGKRQFAELKPLKKNNMRIFAKLEEKARSGLVDFQVLVGNLHVGSVPFIDWYFVPNPFTPKDINKGCHFLRIAAEAGSEEALQSLLKLRQTSLFSEFTDFINYSIGKVFLNKSDPENAFAYLSKVNSTFEHYNDAMFECGNIQYCVFRNKAQALSSFARISGALNGANGLPTIAESCVSNVETSSPPSAMYTFSVTPSEFEQCVRVSGITFRADGPGPHQLFDPQKDKKVSVMRLELIWQQYIRMHPDDMSWLEASVVYRKASNPNYNAYGRYQILRDYFLDENNQGKDFHKVLETAFGDYFLPETSAISPSFGHS